MTRWFEPFIDYGPDCNRATPLHDATIALRHRAYELLSRRGANKLEAGWGADCVSHVLLRFALPSGCRFVGVSYLEQDLDET